MAKAKGTTLSGMVRFLRRHREQAKKLLAPDLHAYLDERIHESRWYPEEHLLSLVDAMVTLMPVFNTHRMVKEYTEKYYLTK